VDFWIFSLKPASSALRINNLIYLAKLDRHQRSLGIWIALSSVRVIDRYLKRDPQQGRKKEVG
jgi:hypothetical protein